MVPASRSDTCRHVQTPSPRRRLVSLSRSESAKAAVLRRLHGCRLGALPREPSRREGRGSKQAGGQGWRAARRSAGASPAVGAAASQRRFGRRRAHTGDCTAHLTCTGRPTRLAVEMHPRRTCADTCRHVQTLTSVARAPSLQAALAAATRSADNVPTTKRIVDHPRRPRFFPTAVGAALVEQGSLSPQVLPRPHTFRLRAPRRLPAQLAAIRPDLCTLWCGGVGLREVPATVAFRPGVLGAHPRTDRG